MSVPLVADPDLALDPWIAAQLLALYFKDRLVADAALRRDWQNVRYRVQGGYSSLNELISVADALLA